MDITLRKELFALKVSTNKNIDSSSFLCAENC
jgi:hypothetical protein